MIVACQNQIWDKQNKMLHPKIPKQVRQRYLTEILGNRNLYTLRRSKRQEQSSMLVQGTNVSKEIDSHYQTLDLGNTSSVPLNSKLQGFALDKKLQLKTESLENTTINIENKVTPIYIRQNFKTTKQNQTNICNLQFKIKSEEQQKVQSISVDRKNQMINHKLQLKTLENRLINRYYTVSVSQNKSTKRKPNVKIQDINILKYQNIQLGDTPVSLMSLWC